MALSMVHLLAAHRWAVGRPEYFESPEYYLGAISPDAMHIRFHNDKSRKNEFHLGNWVSVAEENVHAYWRERFEPFDVGYGIHVLTDGHWIPSVKRDFPELVNELGNVRPMPYYNDVYQTDYALYRDAPEREHLFELLKIARAPKDHPMLSAAELSQWRDEQLAFYDRPCPHGEPVEHIDPKYVLRFLDELIPKIDAITGRYF